MNRPQLAAIAATSDTALAYRPLTDAQVEAHTGATDEAMRFEILKLGLARVPVGYVMIAGCPLVQGVELSEGWVDAMSFAPWVTAGWRRDIERVREAS